MSSDDISIINLELVNKNDKKFIKLNSGRVVDNQQANTKQQIWLDSIKTRMNEIMTTTREEVEEEPQLTYFCLQNDDYPAEIELGLNESGMSIHSSGSEFNRSGSEIGDDERFNSNSRKRVQFICSECGHEFHVLAEFNKHMRHVHEQTQTHTIEENNEIGTSQSPKYKCSMCSREFAALSSKSRHEREHAGLRPFPCHICSYEFSRLSNLRTHLLRVHPKDLDVLYRIGNSSDTSANKIEFNFEAIRQRKQEQTLNNNTSIQQASFGNQPPNNTVIYIRDPKNKNGQIQHVSRRFIYN